MAYVYKWTFKGWSKEVEEFEDSRGRQKNISRNRF